MSTIDVTCETLLEGEHRSTRITKTPRHTTLEIVAFNRVLIISVTRGNTHEHHRTDRPGEGL